MTAAPSPRGGGAPRRPDPCTFVVFGAAGDLTRRLLVPALYNLAEGGLLPEEFALCGVARADLSDAAFRARLVEGLNRFATVAVVPEYAERLLRRVTYLAGDFADPATYRRLAEKLGAAGNCLFYLATPPDVFAEVARGLGQAGLTRQRPGAWRRVIVEKPFGSDLASARRLNRALLDVLEEEQIFRIDHYLGKETVQNILVLRFANGIFEPLWNRDHIDHVQITVAETVSVESRGKFYDATGALRDMVPNHLFQLLALTAMEPPTCFEADAVRSEKTKVLHAVHRLAPERAAQDAVRAQYRAGTVQGRSVAAFRDAPDIAADSITESYVALRLLIDNWRWAGVPFYLRTGKALAARKTEIAVKFKQAPFSMFRDTSIERLAQNFLVLRIQPDEGAALQFNAKVPGPLLRADGVRMDFKYKDYFDAAPSTGYETLIYDCMIGDATQFQRADYVEAGWQVVQPFLDAWHAEGARGLATYAAGSEGPGEADALLRRDGRLWRAIASGPA
ncbi:MAG TPA: glucose-6-phosphate dehydrogenase [Stellaceae bacterium]|nr:glucose-6-phosphate dehydrogenase [Stellaceae bacterium]